MIEEPGSPQQWQIQLIQQVLGGLELKGTELAVVPVEVEEIILLRRPMKSR